MTKPKESLSFAEEREQVVTDLKEKWLTGYDEETSMVKLAEHSFNACLSSSLVTRMAEKLEYYASLDESGYPKPYSTGMCSVLDEFRSALEEIKREK